MKKLLPISVLFLMLSLGAVVSAQEIGSRDVSVSITVSSYIEFEVADGSSINFDSWQLDDDHDNPTLISTATVGTPGTPHLQIKINQPSWKVQVSATPATAFFHEGGSLIVQLGHLAGNKGEYPAVTLSEQQSSGTVAEYDNNGMGVKKLSGTYTAVAPLASVEGGFSDSFTLTYTIVATD